MDDQFKSASPALAPDPDLVSVETELAGEDISEEIIEEDEAAEPSDSEPGPASGPNPLLLGLTLALVFILGLAIGFFGRPRLIKDLPIQVVVTVVPDQSQSVAPAAAAPVEANPGQESANLIEPAGPTPTIMDFVLSDARHFQGSEAAKVTLVEFSDFN
jgi:hypothetical protein